MIRLAHDETAIHYGRSHAVNLLGDVGWFNPEERPRVIDALLNVLPPFKEDGTLDLPVPPGEVDDDTIILYTWAASSLMDAHDPEVRPQVLALFDAGLIDESVFGGREDYQRITEGKQERFGVYPPSDLPAYYERLSGNMGDLPDLSDSDEVSEEEAEVLEMIFKGIKARTGKGDEEVARIMINLAERKASMVEMMTYGSEDAPYAGGHRGYTAPYHAEKAPGRNDPCPCGSGKKYKKCHGTAA